MINPRWFFSRQNARPILWALDAPTVMTNCVESPETGQNWFTEVKRTLGPLSSSGPGSYYASNVCFRSSRGCIMLDFPELFAPARIVSGLIWSVRSVEIDLKPATEMVEIVGRLCGVSLDFPFDLDITAKALALQLAIAWTRLSHESLRLESDSDERRLRVFSLITTL